MPLNATRMDCRASRRRPAALLTAATLLASSSLAALPSLAQAQSTEFKPASVRFVTKRTTTVFPGLDDPAARGGDVGGNPAEAEAKEAVGGRDFASNSAEQRQADLAGAAVLAVRRGNATDEEAKEATLILATAGGRGAAFGAIAAAAGRRANNANNANNANKPSAAGDVRRAWRSINAFDQARAIGNPKPYSYDPPDQAFAVGGKYALAGVNTATRVYDKTTGAPLSPTLDYTALLGLPPYIGVPNGPLPCGDVVVDPTTLYDPETRRWFQTIARVGLDQTTCEENGAYWLEVAVSATASPLGKWHVYSMYASNDGQDGSPAVPGCEEKGCFADFPRAQLDPNVLVVTTNNFAPDEFVGASVVAIDKFALAKGSEQVAVAEFLTLTAGEWDGDALLQSISPAYVAPRKLSSRGGGGGGAGGGGGNGRKKHGRRQHKKKKNKKGGGGGGDAPLPAWKEPFLLLSHSKDDPYRLVRFALTGTRAMKAATTQASLDALSEALTITATPVELPSDPPIITPPTFYRVADQPRAGNFPLGQSQGFAFPGPVGASGDRVFASAVGGGRHVGVFTTMSAREGSDVQFYSVYLAQLDSQTGALLKADVITEEAADLTWPAVALDNQGRGAVVCVASSFDLFMSGVAYPISAGDGAVGGQVMALQGQGLLDTFTTYGLRPRAGDYSVAVIEAETGLLWGAAEYVAEMSCSLEEWRVEPTCGGTRARQANWWSGAFAMTLK